MAEKVGSTKENRRKTKQERKKIKATQKPTGSSESSNVFTYLDLLWNLIAETNPATALGMTVSFSALAASYLLMTKDNHERIGPNGKRLPPMATIKNKAKSMPASMGSVSTPGGPRGTAAGPKEYTDDGLEKIPTDLVARMFQTAYQSQRSPNGKQMLDHFYTKVSEWKPRQLDANGRVMVCNFLFWYYRAMRAQQLAREKAERAQQAAAAAASGDKDRSSNSSADNSSESSKPGLSSKQAHHIREWAAFEIKRNSPQNEGPIQSKYDLLYSCAQMQRSIPHLRHFYKWICKEPPLGIPDELLDQVNAASGYPPVSESALGANGEISVPAARSPHGSTKGGPSPSSSSSASSSGTRGSGVNGGGPGTGGGGGSLRSSKNSYVVSRFQAACLLGRWDDIEAMGKVLENLSKKAGSRVSQSNYIMAYSYRAIEFPLRNVNFGQFYKMAPRARKKFVRDCLPSPAFGEWVIHSWKYRNMDPSISVEENARFVVSANELIDKSTGYTHILPFGAIEHANKKRSQESSEKREQSSKSRIPRGPRVGYGFKNRVSLMGRMCQLHSPMCGRNRQAYMPLTGLWSDSKIYAEWEWDFYQNGRSYLKKGVFEIDRLPTTKKVVIPPKPKLSNLFGGGAFGAFGGPGSKMNGNGSSSEDSEGKKPEMDVIEEGFEWEGTLRVSLTPAEVSMSMGRPSGDKKYNESERETQIYECQLVIADAVSTFPGAPSPS